jgi:hypothetical protein
MTENVPGSFRTLAFGDLDGGVWGAAWVGPASLVAIGALTGAEPAILDAVLSGSSADTDWTLAGEAIDLTIAAHGEAAGSPQLDGFDQLCHVRGRAVLAGQELTIDALGRRGMRADIELGSLDSIRDVSAWFPPDDGIAVTALRPRRASGHEGDLVVASLFEPSGAVAVADPRLSTTYAADGSPSRAGIELWLDSADEDEEQYPRRAAGEAIGPAVVAAGDGLTVAAQVLRWHSRGQEGLGMYTLARAR